MPTGNSAPITVQVLIISGNNGDNVLTSGASSDILKGYGGDDTLYGGGGNDTLYGHSGNDKLYGGGGNDTLNGGTGDDLMAGGTGNDVYIVDSSSDRVSEAANAGVDTIRTLKYLTVLPPNAENLTAIYPNGHAVLIGNNLGNVITGSIGGDFLVGEGGNDTLIGGLGNDTYLVENAGDIVKEGVNAGFDTVLTDLSSYTLTANIEFARATSTLGSVITGNSLENEIQGGNGHDVLKGMGGQDALFGNLGHDTLIGGTQSDVFVFDMPIGPTNTDVIADFNTAEQDYISLENTGTGLFNALPVGYLDSVLFKRIGLGGSVDSNDRIIYNQSTGQLYYDPDGSGAKSAVQFATLSNHAVISATEFWVY